MLVYFSFFFWFCLRLEVADSLLKAQEFWDQHSYKALKTKPSSGESRLPSCPEIETHSKCKSATKNTLQVASAMNDCVMRQPTQQNLFQSALRPPHANLAKLLLKADYSLGWLRLWLMMMRLLLVLLLLDETVAPSSAPTMIWRSLICLWARTHFDFFGRTQFMRILAVKEDRAKKNWFGFSAKFIRICGCCGFSCEFLRWRWEWPWAAATKVQQTVWGAQYKLMWPKVVHESVSEGFL